MDRLKLTSTSFLLQLLIGGLCIYCALVLGYGVRQSDFSRIIIHYAGWFAGYIVLYLLCPAKQLRFWLFFGVLLRFLLVFGLPTLSDDLYRFIWDGRLWLNGINPFDHKPVYFIENGLDIPGLDRALYEQLNSPEYFTIYPPVAQLVFVIACWIFPGSILGSSIVMKLFLLTAELGSLFLIRRLLQHFGRSPKLILLYALNPLIIIEIVGNLHFEGFMVFFLLLAYWLWIKGSWWKGGIAMSLSILSKLLPLMFLPFVIRRMGWKKSIWTFLLMGGLIIAGFLPLFNAAFIHNFSDSLDLYFRRFEFNAGVYYVLRWLGYQLMGYNLIAYIGPGLALITLLSICWLALSEKNKDWESWPSRALFAITVYLLMGTIIHPWYLSLPVVLCIFTNVRYPVLWSGLIFMTYINYSYSPYFENLWVVGLEYGLVVLVMIGEWRKKAFFF